MSAHVYAEPKFLTWHGMSGYACVRLHPEKRETAPCSCTLFTLADNISKINSYAAKTTHS